jgi:predicted nucleic acid-binding protein
LAVVTEAVLCLDTGVWIKFLVAEESLEQSEAAARLVLRAISAGRLVVPAFAWAEIGRVLRKKVRQGLFTMEQAGELWTRFGQFPVEFMDGPALRSRAWELAAQYGLPTLYDAAFLACTEIASARVTVGEFWTADQALLRALGTEWPPYVRLLEATPSS